MWVSARDERASKIHAIQTREGNTKYILATEAFHGQPLIQK